MQIYAGHGTPAATCTCGTADCLGAGGFGTGVVAGAVAGGAGAVAGAGRGAGVVAGAGAFAGVGVGGAVGCANAKVLAAALLASGVAAAMCAFAGGATVFGGGGEGMDVAFGGAIAVPLLATATLLVGAVCALAGGGEALALAVFAAGAGRAAAGEAFRTGDVVAARGVAIVAVPLPLPDTSLRSTGEAFATAPSLGVGGKGGGLCNGTSLGDAFAGTAGSDGAALASGGLFAASDFAGAGDLNPPSCLIEVMQTSGSASSGLGSCFVTNEGLALGRGGVLELDVCGLPG